jgi:hypothetical protein
MKFFLNLVVKDKKGTTSIFLSLYNQVKDQEEAERVFPKGTEIAVICPYMKRTSDLSIRLRNDLPQNIITRSSYCKELKEIGNKYFREKNYSEALRCYKNAIHKTNETTLNLAIYSNTA